MRIEPEASPMRLLETLSDRFGIFEAVAHSSIKLSRLTSEDELSMDLFVAEAVLEFGSDLRRAYSASMKWAELRGMLPRTQDGAGEGIG
jgi:hypothetical protein